MTPMSRYIHRRVAAQGIADFAGAIRNAVDDSEITYVLGFYPSSEKLDGRFIL